MEPKAKYTTAMPPELRAAYDALIERMEELRQSGCREFKVRELTGAFVVAEIGPERATVRRKPKPGPVALKAQTVVESG